MRKTSSRAHTFSNTETSSYVGNQVSVVPVVTALHFWHWSLIHSERVWTMCLFAGLVLMTWPRENSFSDSTAHVVWNRTHHFILTWPLELQHFCRFTPHKADKLTPSVGSCFKVFELDLLLMVALVFKVILMMNSYKFVPFWTYELFQTHWNFCKVCTVLRNLR